MPESENFNKIVSLSEACNFIKREALAQVFSCEFYEISENTISYRTPPVATSGSGGTYRHKTNHDKDSFSWSQDCSKHHGDTSIEGGSHYTMDCIWQQTPHPGHY